MPEKRRHSPPVCPACGAEVPAKARACPECGADERTGWNTDQALYDGLDLPDTDFNYDDFARREFGVKRHRVAAKRVLWVVLTAAILLVFVITVLLD